MFQLIEDCRCVSIYTERGFDSHDDGQYFAWRYDPARGRKCEPSRFQKMYVRVLSFHCAKSRTV